MTDIHMHILPGVDDGAADWYDAMEMAQIAADNGVSAIVATPHCNIPGYCKNYAGESLKALLKTARNRLKQEKIEVNLYAGMEIFATPQVPRLIQRGLLWPVNGGHYMLIEFFQKEDPVFAEGLLEQIRALGICPVIAHPERYAFVQEDICPVRAWKNRGYGIQVNRGSLQGRFGKEAFQTAHRLLRLQLADVIASDAHSPYVRTPNLAEAYAELAELYPKEYIRLLMRENPSRICMDRPLLYPEKIFYRKEWDEKV